MAADSWNRGFVHNLSLQMLVLLPSLRTNNTSLCRFAISYYIARSGVLCEIMEVRSHNINIIQTDTQTDCNVPSCQ